MSSLVAVRPYPFTGYVSTIGGTAAPNLATDDPREIDQAGPATLVQYAIDLGAIREVDTIYVGGHNLPAGSAVGVSYGIAGVSETVGPQGIRQQYSRANPANRHFFEVAATPFFCRYLLVSIFATYSVTMKTGRIIIGKSFDPTYGREWGSGRIVFDTGSRETLRYGGFGVADGIRKGGYQWTMGDLTDAEVDDLYRLIRGVGATRATVFCEDPDEAAPGFVSLGNGTVSGGTAPGAITQTFTRSATTAAWNAAAYIPTLLEDSAAIFGKANTAGHLFVLGLARAPSITNANTSIDYGIQYNNGALSSVIQGTTTSLATSATTSDQLGVVYEDGFIRFLKGSTVLGSPVAIGQDAQFYPAVAINGNAHTVTINGLGGSGFWLGDRLHYGVFDKLEPYERIAVGATRWSMRFEDWL